MSKFNLRYAWLGGLLFAVHPVQVESVAWIAELKNTLSLLPFLWAMCAYLDYDRLGKRRDYFLALSLFLVALLCKITPVMFPLVILLHAWWRRDRIGWADLKAAAPFFAVSLAIGLIPILSGAWDKAFGHLGPAFMPPGGIDSRLVLVGLEMAFYFSKCVLPVELLPVYPKWTVDSASPIQYLPWIALAGLMVWLWTRRRTWGRHVTFGLGFFLINLLPCPGFIPGSNMGYAWVMDHFVYLPIIGLIGLAAAVLETMESAPNFGSSLSLGAAVIIPIVMAWGSHAYAKLYSSSLALWTYADQHNPGSWMVHYNLGDVFLNQGQVPEALSELNTALKIFPGNIGLHNDLGHALSLSGQLSDAILQYRMVAELDPNFRDAAYVLGTALVSAHRTPEAIAQFEKILRQNPGHAAAHIALGNIFLSEGRQTEAENQFAQAAAIDTRDGRIHYDLGTALLKANQLPEALIQLQQAARIEPNDVDVLSNLGVVLARLGRVPEAAQLFEKMLQIDPNSAAAHTNMGSLFLIAGKLPEARAQYEEALRDNPDFTEAQQDLARVEKMGTSVPAAPAPP